MEFRGAGSFFGDGDACGDKVEEWLDISGENVKLGEFYIFR